MVSCRKNLVVFLKFAYFKLKVNCFTVLLVSAVHQCESAIRMRVSLPSGTFLPLPHPSRLSQSPSLSSLSHRENCHWVFFKIHSESLSFRLFTFKVLIDIVELIPTLLVTLSIHFPYSLFWTVMSDSL